MDGSESTTKRKLHISSAVWVLVFALVGMAWPFVQSHVKDREEQPKVSVKEVNPQLDKVIKFCTNPKNADSKLCVVKKPKTTQELADSIQKTIEDDPETRVIYQPSGRNSVTRIERVETKTQTKQPAEEPPVVLSGGGPPPSDPEPEPVKVPEVKIPEIKVPEVKIEKIKVPEVKVPKVDDLLKDVKAASDD